MFHKVLRKETPGPSHSISSSFALVEVLRLHHSLHHGRIGHHIPLVPSTYRPHPALIPLHHGRIGHYISFAVSIPPSSSPHPPTSWTHRASHFFSAVKNTALIQPSSNRILDFCASLGLLGNSRQHRIIYFSGRNGPARYKDLSKTDSRRPRIKMLTFYLIRGYLYDHLWATFEVLPLATRLIIRPLSLAS